MSYAFASPEERLVVLLSYAKHDAAEAAEAQALAARVVAWDEVLELTLHNASAPLAHANLVKLELFEGLPKGVRQRFEARSAEVERQNEARLVVGRELFKRFEEAGLPVVILKGILFAETVYRNAYYKKMNDIDLLVRQEDLDGVFDVYEALDFFSAGELIGGNPREQEKFSHHSPPFFSKNLDCMVGTHWGLITPLAPYEIDYEAIWSRVVDVDFYGATAKAMAPEDNVHHLCVHLPYYKTGVRELADIYNVIREVGPAFDWELFLNEVAKAKTENLVYHALMLSNRLCPLVEVTEVLRQIEPRVSRYYRDDAQRKTASLSGLLRCRSVHLSVIEKAFTKLNASKDPKEMREAFLRMWRNFLFAPGEEVDKLNSLHQPSFLRRLRARAYTPYRISKVFVRDLGPGIFLMLMGKTFHDVVRASLTAPFRAQSDAADLAGVMRARGIDPESVERLLEHLE